jgi:hypothetical protein
VPVFAANGLATVEGIVVQTPSRIVDVSTGAVLRMFEVNLSGGEVRLTGGDLSIDRSTLTDLPVSCTTADLTIKRSRADQTAMSASNCQVLISRSHLGPGSTTGGAEQLSTDLGVVVIENSLIVEDRDGLIAVQLNQAAPGSAFRFNTIVRTSQGQTATKALSCPAEVTVTSNIFAFNSTLPLNIQCTADRSLFDEPGAATAMRGTGNVSADVATFFKDRANGDFHLGANSPARSLGEPNLVDEDFDGGARPVPAGSDPDSGAFETP